MPTITDRQAANSVYVTSRLRNLTGTAEGITLPPQQSGPTRVPTSSGFKIATSQAVTGGQQFTFVWDSPNLSINNVVRFNIFYLFAQAGGQFDQKKLQGPFSATGAPMTLTVPMNPVVPLTFILQTELVGGLKSDVTLCPTCSWGFV